MKNKPIRGFQKSLKTAAATAVLALALAGCASSGGNSSSGNGSKPDTTLTLASLRPPVSLDPVLQNINSQNRWFVNLAYDTLIRVDSEGKLVPDLATEWKYTDDTNTTFQLTLREGVKFSDGTPFTAEAVVASLDYAQKKGINGPNWLKGISSITAPDASTVIIKTSEPTDALPYLLSQRLLMGSIISPAGLADTSGLKNATHGVGPYVLDPDTTIANDTYTYVPNENYWDKTKIHWNKVVIKVVENAAAALQATQAGQVDIFIGDSATAKAATNAKVGMDLVQSGLMGVTFGDRNGEVAPELKDPRVRQALSYAIDRKSIANAVYGENAVPNATLTVEGLAGYSAEEASAFEYNPEKAKSLLADAGYSNGFSFNTATTTNGSANLMAQAVVENWKSIGVTATLNTYADEGQLVTDILAKKYPVTFYDYGSLPMYIQAKSFFTGGATQYNPWNTTDKGISESLTEAAQSADASQQNVAYNKALQRAVVDLSWVSGIYTAPVVLIYNDKKVTGVGMTASSATPDVAWTVAPLKK